MEKAVIAVDAGGTKTKVAVFNANGDIVYEVTGNSGSPAALKEVAFQNMMEVVETAYLHTKNNYQITCIQMGISGLGVVQDKSAYEKKWKEKFGVEVFMENDALIALFSIVEDKYDQGVLVLSGTGSATYGMNEFTTRLIGGWGHLLTETGSAYASVRMLVNHIIREYEEEETISDLGKKFMMHIGISEVNDFKIFMYQNSKGEIASYSKFLSKEAANGEKIAMSILKQCGIDLAKNVVLLYKHLHLQNQAVIGFRGSFVQYAHGVKEAFIEELEKNNIKANIVHGKEDPVYGAYYIAKRKGFLC